MKLRKFFKAFSYSLTLGVVLVGGIENAFAGRVDLSVGWEEKSFRSDYSYAGLHLNMGLRPDNSNWHFVFDHKDRQHDSRQHYNETVAKASYRMNYAGGWVQPGFQVRRDSIMFPSGSRRYINKYRLDTQYVHLLRGRWGLWGRVLAGLESQKDESYTNNSNHGHLRRSDYFSWEVEQGIRYFWTNRLQTTLSYYDSGKQSDKGENWGITDHRSIRQVRGYMYHRVTDNLTFSPYFRIPVGWNEERPWYIAGDNPDGVALKQKLSRYALKLSYRISPSFIINGEYYLEKIEYKDGNSWGRDDGDQEYFKLALRYTF